MTLNLTGTLMPEQQSEVTPAVAGRVNKVLIERGSVVKAGQPLLRFAAISTFAAPRRRPVRSSRRPRRGWGSLARAVQAARVALSPMRRPRRKRRGPTWRSPRMRSSAPSRCASRQRSASKTSRASSPRRRRARAVCEHAQQHAQRLSGDQQCEGGAGTESSRAGRLGGAGTV